MVGMMCVSRFAVLASIAVLVGCAPAPRLAADGNGRIILARDVGGLVLDADRRAVSHIAGTLTAPSRQRGSPAAQAQALGFFEFATIALTGPRWVGLDQQAVMLLRRGREELREAHGIRQDAPGQIVSDSFFRAASALSVGDQSGAIRSFPPAILTRPAEEVIGVLRDPPAMPNVVWASGFAGDALNRFDRGGSGFRVGWLQR